MKVLVTGGAGFIGSHFIRHWLRQHPTDQIVNLDARTYASTCERLADLATESRYRAVEGDICDARIVREAMRGCDLVVHFAAETHVDRSITDAAPFMRTNVEGTCLLLEQARAASVTRFLHLSSDEVYGPVLQGAVDETAPLSPRSPYAASKAAGDLLAQAYAHTYGLPVTVVRPTNIFGPAQLPEKFIPLCITSACDGRSIPLYGDGQQRRAWLFVDDLVEALGVVLERGEPGRVYNIGSGEERTNWDTVHAVLALTHASPALVQRVADRPGHDRRYAMRDEAVRALGWQPRVSFEEGLQRTIAWYRQQTAWWRPLTQQLREDPYHWLNRPARSGAPEAIHALK
jgi:dTDP-glucose 4,6-dehydratase